MALRVWLPLDGNLNNQGLDGGVTVTNTGATVNSVGKIGSCYSFTTSQYMELNNLPFASLTNCSISFWAKITGKGSSGWLPFAGQSTSYYILATTSGTGNFYHSTNNVGKSSKVYKDGVQTLVPGALNEWHHYVVAGLNLSGWTKFYINKYNSAWNFAGQINDVRIYDHCLSPKEVKEISKGLVVHYKLDGSEANGIGGTNLIANGWSGTENWNGTSGISTDVPPNVPGAINSYSNKLSQEYILLHPNHSYTISEYAKRGTSTYNYLYISCIPYDIDKLPIYNFMQADGFIAASRTTLSQDLNPGDTVVHLTSAAGWTTTSTYAYRIAIFGYKDSTGYTYPDMIYTRRIYAWGTTTDKSHLDKTNNTVTLNAAYTGEKIPAGTTVCQTSDGSTYYYAASVNSSGHEGTEWFFLTRTFTPNSVNYLKAAKYIRIYSTLYSGQWGAAITLIDNTADSIIEDTSGYGNNGMITGQLSVSVDTPRYGKCAEFDGNTASIKIPYNANIWGSNFTMNVWWKKTELGSKNYETLIGGPSGFEMDTRAGGATSLTLYMASTRGGNVYTGFEFNKWYMVTLAADTEHEYYYVNGQLVKTIDKKSMPVGNYYIGAWQSASSQNYKGTMSDVRIYATVLSADDILELYNTAAFIDDGYNMNTYEFVEDQTNIFTSESLMNSAAHNSETTGDGHIVERNGTPAIMLQAWNFYYGSGDDRNTHLQYGFKEGKRYLFDMWLDTDDEVNNNGANYSSGLNIIYTDGSSYSFKILGDKNNPKGFQHLRFITPSNKSVKGIGVIYYYGKPVYYRLDSTITEYQNPGMVINHKGILNYAELKENINYESINYNDGGLIETKNIYEI